MGYAIAAKILVPLTVMFQAASPEMQYEQ